MPASILVLSSAVLLAFLNIPATAGDLKIVTRQTVNGRAYTTTQYFSASSLRFQTDSGSDNVEGHHLATIVHHGDTTSQNFQLDLDAREYTTYETDKRGIALNAKSYPARPSEGRMDIWIESKDTGERRQMFGHTARHIITTEKRVPGAGSSCTASETETDGWYVDYSILPEWRRPTGHTINLVVGGNCRDKIEVHRSGVETGFALERKDTSIYRGTDGSQPVTSVSVMEVVEFSEGPLDPALFEPPSDFRRVNELTSMNKFQPRTPWQKVKNWVSEIFR